MEPMAQAKARSYLNHPPCVTGIFFAGTDAEKKLLARRQLRQPQGGRLGTGAWLQAPLGWRQRHTALFPLKFSSFSINPPPFPPSSLSCHMPALYIGAYRQFAASFLSRGGNQRTTQMPKPSRQASRGLIEALGIWFL